MNEPRGREVFCQRHGTCCGLCVGRCGSWRGLGRTHSAPTDDCFRHRSSLMPALQPLTVHCNQLFNQSTTVRLFTAINCSINQLLTVHCNQLLNQSTTDRLLCYLTLPYNKRQCFHSTIPICLEYLASFLSK